MQRFFLRCALASAFIFFTCLFVSAQDLTGIWKGYFVTNDGLQYKLEFQVKQNNATSISGVSYSYLDVRFYGKATMSGSLNKLGNQFQIQELRTVEVKNMDGGGTCLMKYLFSYARSGKEEFLEGTFVGKSEDRHDPKNDGNWGDCGSGKVYLRRVQSSDFYVEPFLRDNPKPTPHIDPRNPKPNILTSPANNNTVVAKKTNPKPKGTGVKKKLPPPKTVTTKPNHRPPANPHIIKANAIPITDSTRLSAVNPAIKTPQKTIFTPDILKTRQNELAKTIIVNTEQVSIRLYDNGEIDGDSISVFVDNKLTLSHRGLSTVPITLNLTFDANNTEHEVVMVAENLGRIPPNTSLMIIDAGDKRYQVQITSTEQKNALVRFKYENPVP